MLPLNINIEHTQKVSEPKNNSVDSVSVYNVIHYKEFIYLYLIGIYIFIIFFVTNVILSSG